MVYETEILIVCTTVITVAGLWAYVKLRVIKKEVLELKALLLKLLKEVA
jgi:hypothetical protein